MTQTGSAATHLVPARSHFLTAGLLLCVLAVYVVARICLVPADVAVTDAFSHDSAYLAIVAQQLRLGNGFVNPAHWLLPLNPAVLPMPYHNGNPGYPAMMAAAASLFRIDVVQAGAWISVLGNALLACAVFALVTRYSRDRKFALLAAVAAALLPANWMDSSHVSTDALCTALSMAAIAICLLRRDLTGPALAGAVLGAAWLVRPSASLLILPLLWWVSRTRSRDQALQSAGLLLACFGLVVSPWLMHTRRVWGSPFRSDAGIYLMQEYSARAAGETVGGIKSVGAAGEVLTPRGIAVDHFYRSLRAPAPLGEVLRKEPGDFIRFYLNNVPFFLYILMGAFTGWNKFLGACYILLTAAAFWQWKRCRTPEFEAGLLLALLTVATLVIRAHYFELRFLGPVSTLWLLWVLLPLRDAWRARAGGIPWLWRGAVALLAAGCLGIIALEDAKIMRVARAASPEKIELRETCRKLAAELNEQRVLIPDPYFYTWYTGRTGISPPYAPKQDVLTVMSKYSARYIALPANHLDYYYPDALRTLAPELRQVNSASSLVVFEVKQ